MRGIAAVVGRIALATCLMVFAFARAAAADDGAGIVLQLKWHHQFQFAGYYAALDQGFYAAEGLAVTILEGSATRPPIPAVLAGGATFGVGDAEVLLARLKGQPLVVCAAVFQHSPYILLSRRDRGVFTPTDLAGARVMVSEDQGAAQVRAMLAREGIDAQRVTFLSHSWNLDDLIAGRVDAISAYASVEPFQLRARGVEPAVLRSADYGIDFYGDILFTTERQVAENPEQVAAFVRASMRGWTWAFQHVDETIAVILALPGVRERGITAELLREEARVMRELVLPDVVDLGHMNAGRWRRIAEIAAELGLAPANVSLRGFLWEPNPAVDLTAVWWISGIAGVFLLALVAVSQWNVQMGRQVRARTAELQDEIRRRELVEQELRASEERFRQIAENIREVFWVTDPAKGRMLYVSPAYEAIWGRSCASLYQEPAAWLDAIDPEDRERVAAEVARQAAGELYDAVYRIRQPNGQLRWIHDRGYPVFDAEGRLYRVVGTAEDITERRQIEERTQEQARLLDLTRDAILVTNLDHSIRYWSRGAEVLYGWSASEACGGDVERILADDGTRRRAWDETLTSGEWRGELQQVTRAGARLLIESRWSLVRDEQGRPSAVLEISSDISERRRIEQQLFRAQRLESIGTLAGGIAHDLNNLLAPILIGVELIEADASSGRIRSLVDTIGQSARRGAELVKQVLTFSRGMEGSRVPLPVKALFRELQVIVDSTFPKSIQLTSEVPNDAWMVAGDPTQLSQVLLNLAVNARDAMPKGGRLAIRARNEEIAIPRSLGLGVLAAGRYLVVEVSDSGTGIAPEHLDRIFDPFFTTKEVGKGTGLGLSTVLGIIGSHGGQVEVESELGRGSTFRLYLPALVGSDVVGPSAGTIASPALAGDGELILVVDDEALILDVARQTLERQGYRVVVASDGAAALAAHAGQRDALALVVTDLMMPVMDGVACIRALRQAGSTLPIIATSGLATDAAELAELGVRHILPKPYSGDELLRVVRAALVGRPVAEGSAGGRTLPGG